MKSFEVQEIQPLQKFKRADYSNQNEQVEVKTESGNIEIGLSL